VEAVSPAINEQEAGRDEAAEAEEAVQRYQAREATVGVGVPSADPSEALKVVGRTAEPLIEGSTEITGAVPIKAVVAEMRLAEPAELAAVTFTAT
jgi:hypothetical protein